MKLIKLIWFLCLFWLPLQLSATDLTASEEAALIDAINSDDIQAIKKYTNKGANLNPTLFNAVSRLNLDILTLFVENGADVNLKDYNGNTPLHILARIVLGKKQSFRNRNSEIDDKIIRRIRGARAERLDLINYLVLNGADINAVNNDNSTPIYLAFQTNQPMVVDYFITKKVDPNVGRNLFQSSAMRNFDTGYLRYLLDYGYRATPDSDDKSTPLHQLLSASIDKDKIDLLIEYGADVNALDAQGKTPLIVGLANESTEPEALAKALTAVGAEITPAFAQTQLYEAMEARDIAIVNKLIDENPSLINSTDAAGLAPLILASRGSLKLVRILLSRSAEINTRSNGLNALDEAISTNHDYIAKYLIKQGIDVNVFKDDKRKEVPLLSPALSAAVSNNNLEMVMLLLESNATTLFDGPADDSPIVVAIGNGNLAIVKLLVENGADTNIETKEGPLHVFAQAVGASEIADYLASINSK